MYISYTHIYFEALDDSLSHTTDDPKTRGASGPHQERASDVTIPKYQRDLDKAILAQATRLRTNTRGKCALCIYIYIYIRHARPGWLGVLPPGQGHHPQ